MHRRRSSSRIAAITLAVCLPFLSAHAEDKKPNILVIWGDDIGQFNLSAYNRGMMGYKTPNIDSIANQGALFTDWYGASKAAPLAARHSSQGNRRSGQV